MCVCVCARARVRSDGRSSDSITIKDAVVCNFDLAFLPCYLYPRPMLPMMKEDRYKAEYNVFPSKSILILYLFHD